MPAQKPKQIRCYYSIRNMWSHDMQAPLAKNGAVDWQEADRVAREDISEQIREEIMKMGKGDFRELLRLEDCMEISS